MQIVAAAFDTSCQKQEVNVVADETDMLVLLFWNSKMIYVTINSEVIWQSMTRLSKKKTRLALGMFLEPSANQSTERMSHHFIPV